MGFSLATPAPAFDERYELWPEKLKIGGRVIVDNGLQDYEPVRELPEVVAAGDR